MNQIGVMQGRLSPPSEGRIQAFPKTTWADEFVLAREAGLELIEWIVEADEVERNPFLAETDRVAALCLETGVAVRSLCADYFMDRPLLRCSAAERDERLGMLERIIALLPRLGVRHLTIPFVDASAILTEAELSETAAMLKPFLPALERAGADLALETSLDPRGFRRLLDLLDHPCARVNYDIGNSASLGYAPAEEFAAYGAQVATVHVKDRLRGGTTVPLGKGDADFPAVFSALARLDYAGPFILQAARQIPGEEAAAVKSYAAMIRGWHGAHFAHGPASSR